MIHRLRKVTDDLYRGSAPTPKDVLWLKENFDIKKIVSLDKVAGDKIDRATKLLGIKHIMLPIEMPHLRQSLLNFLKHDLKKLLLEDGPTYVHCAEGKDRTGLAVALVQCKYFGKNPEDALEEAKSLGFGLDVEPGPIHMFEKLIRACKPADINSADIVSNEREYIGDNRDSYLEEGNQSSFAPYLDPTKRYPLDTVYLSFNDQSPTRENYTAYKSIKEHDKEEDFVPQVGLFNNDAGNIGFGPAINPGGFIYD